jgi:hypothetical protein
VSLYLCVCVEYLGFLGSLHAVNLDHLNFGNLLRRVVLLASVGATC